MLKTILLALLALFVLWDPIWWMLGSRQMPPWRLKRLLRENPGDLRLVDLRTPFEYRLFHIPGAESRPDLLRRPGELHPEPGQTTVLICMTSHRSPPLARMFRDRPGESTLTVGMVGWFLNRGPVARGPRGAKTDQ